MGGITIKEIVETSGVRLLCDRPGTSVEHISVDSRTMKGNDLFIPLIGEKVSAHRFIMQVIGAGAIAVFASEHDQMEGEQSGGTAWIRMEDMKKALQSVGVWYRSRLNLSLIGVTGSVKKTTTREMINAALSAGYRVYKTPDSHNSQVGMPITLSEISSKDEIGVTELRISEPGELTVIIHIAQVDMAVTTNIGLSHVGQLGTQDNIYLEEMSIQDGLKPGGILFLNGDDGWLKRTKVRKGFSTVHYGLSESCSCQTTDVCMVDSYPSSTAVHGDERVLVQLQVMGAHQILNALVALTVAGRSGVPMEEAVKAPSQSTGFEERQQAYRGDGLTIVDDSHNASPMSMKAAIDILVSVKPVDSCMEGYRIIVLADMREPEEHAPWSHYEIGEYLAELPVDTVMAYGELAQEIARGIEAHTSGISICRVSDKKELTAFLDRELETGGSVLFKGSNSMKLGEVVEHVRQYHH